MKGHIRIDVHRGPLMEYDGERVSMTITVDDIKYAVAIENGELMIRTTGPLVIAPKSSNAVVLREGQ